VRPDVVAISRINKTSVEVGYPHSWNTPSSYFPLIFQVKEIRCRKGKKCDCSKPNLLVLLTKFTHNNYRLKVWKKFEFT